MSNNYDAQKKYLAGKKQLRVWVDPAVYDEFKRIAEAKGESVYSVINDFMRDYIKGSKGSGE